MLTPHSIIHGDACFAYFNKIWGIPWTETVIAERADACPPSIIDIAQLLALFTHKLTHTLHRCGAL